MTQSRPHHWAVACTAEEIQTQCSFRVEPQLNTETSICAALQESSIPGFHCGVCGRQGARQQTVFGDLPSFLVVHVNKQAGHGTGLPAESNVRISGTELRRFAAVHHAGRTPTSGHYTSTVAAGESAYHCDDLTIDARPDLVANAWDDTYLVFLQKRSTSCTNP